MNADLLTAIQSVWNASETLSTTFPDGLWVSRAKKGANLPQCVLTLVANATDYNTCNTYVEKIVIQFTAYASDTGNVDAADLLLATADAIEAAYNRQPIPTTTDTVLLCRKLTGGLPRYEDDKVWRIDLEYQLWVQRNPETEIDEGGFVALTEWDFLHLSET